MEKRHLTVTWALGVMMMTVLAAPGLAREQAVGQASGPKKPGVKRIGIATSGSSGESIRAELIALLDGGGVIEVVPLTSRLASLRQAEAATKECDFVLETSFEARPAGERGGLFSRLTKAAETINRESESFNNSAERREDVDKKTSSLDSIVNDLAPQPRDKVRVEYSLLRSGASAPLLSDTAEVEAAGLQAFLEKFLDAVSAAVLK